jgi:uncharacterized protein (TIGR00251 family)
MAEKRNIKFQNAKIGAAITVRIIPRSDRNEVVELMPDGIIKIRITAPPVDGKANSMLLQFLSKLLDVPISALEIVSGATGKTKLISIIGKSPDEVNSLLEKNVRQSK